MVEPKNRRLVTEAALELAVGPLVAKADLPALVSAGVFDASRTPTSLFALRQKAQIEASTSRIIGFKKLTWASGATTNNNTWSQITGSGFTFVVPKSGAVSLIGVLPFSMPAGLAELSVRLHDVAGNPFADTERRLSYQALMAVAIQGQAPYAASLTNLTPGTTVTIFLAVRNSASTSQPSLTSGGVFGPALITINSFPAPETSDTAVVVRMEESTTSSWTAAKAAVAAGTRDAKILCIGDSTQMGYLTDNPAKFMASALGELGLATVPGGTTGGRAAGANPRYTFGSGWAPGNIYGFGSQAWQYTNPSGAMTYADPDVPADSFDVYYLRASGSTSITLQIDSETAQTFTTTGSTSIQKLTITSATTGPSTSRTLRVTAAGSGSILFVEPWLSTAKRIRVANAGAPSTNSVTWAQGSGIYSRSMMFSYSPDVVICLLGANDTIGNATPTSTFIENIKALAAAVPTAMFIIVSPAPCQIAAEYAQARDYAVRERYELAYPMIDLGQYFGTWDQANAKGWMSDLRHPNTTGMQKQGRLYAKALEPSVTLDPAPAT